MKDESQKTIIPMVEKSLDLYRATDDPEEKSKIIHGVLAKAVYTKTARRHWACGKADDFELSIYLGIQRLVIDNLI